MRHTTILLVAGLALAGGATALSLQADTEPPEPEALEPDETDEEADADVDTAVDAEVGAEVTVRNFEFSDEDTGTSVTHVEAGDTVRWTWRGGAHSVTHGVRGPGSEPVGPSAFDSDVRSTSYDEDGTPTTTFEVTFDEPGAYEYFCKPHPQMEGLVLVGGGA